MNSDENNQSQPEPARPGSTNVFRMVLLLGGLAIVAGALLRFLAHHLGK